MKMKPIPYKDIQVGGTYFIEMCGGFVGSPTWVDGTYTICENMRNDYTCAPRWFTTESGGTRWATWRRRFWEKEDNDADVVVDVVTDVVTIKSLRKGKEVNSMNVFYVVITEQDAKGLNIEILVDDLILAHDEKDACLKVAVANHKLLEGKKYRVMAKSFIV